MENYKNILLTCLVCITVWVGYDTFLKPKAPEVTSVEKVAPSALSNLSPTYLSVATALKEPHVAISNSKVQGKIRLKGALLNQWFLTQYHTQVGQSQPLELLAPYGTKQGYVVMLGWTSEKPEIHVPSLDTVWHLDPSSTKTKTCLTWTNAQGVRFEQTFRIDESYMLSVDQAVYNESKQPVSVKPYNRIVRQAPVQINDHWLSYEGPLAVSEHILKNVPYDTMKKNTTTYTQVNWTGISDKYWLVSFIGNKGDEKNSLETQFIYDLKTYTNDHYVVTLQDQQGHDIAPGTHAVHTQHIFLGPKQTSTLDAYAQKFDIKRLDLAIDFGWFYFITKPLTYILSFFNQWLGSAAGAILLLTICVRILFFPLAVKSARSAAAMQRIQPQMLVLKEKFQDDKVKLHQSIMELYRAQKVNPFAGIWPALVQAPLFFALYKILFVSIEMRHAPFWGWIQDLSAPDPTSIFTLCGLVPITLPKMLTIGLWPIIMGLSMILQQRFSGANYAAMDKSQQVMMMYGLPVIFVWMMANFPVGLIIYWSWNNLLAVAQQYVIRSFNLTGNHV
jgi:YidC/Oxa1 family membrane protein insertase